MEKPSPRQTKIVVTLGPASMVPEVLAGLVALDRMVEIADAAALYERTATPKRTR